MELTFHHLEKRYGKKEALKGVSTTLTPGIYGLLGPNGAGKSTLMNILTGNLKQTAGQVLFDGRDVCTLGRDFSRRLGYCPQQEAFYPSFTAEQFLYYAASLQGMEKKVAEERITWVLEVLSLSDVRRKAIRGFSGGMRRRLLLAQAILHDPDILVLDEPTAGLDPRQRIAVRNLIGEIALHKIVLISTHVVQDVEYIAKELILLSQGNILCRDTPEGLIARLEGQVWETMVEESELGKMGDYGTLCGVRKAQGKVSVRLISSIRPPVPCEAVWPNLEDVYLHFFGGEGL